VHKGLVLSPYLFFVATDEITKELQREVSWCMMFADDIDSVGENLEEVNKWLDKWR